jgi:1-acyl-sn-glycerol-3-phosphate acyltransferase
LSVLVEGVHALARLFYPVRGIRGAMPPRGPCVVVANHPNGLLDPVILRVGLSRPLSFLAKHTLFGNPILRPLLEAFGALPVYRAREADTSRNEETFARARELLGRGGWLALFPEGISHDAPALQPLRTGVARIVLGGPPGVSIVPVGLTYADKGTFRSSVTLSIGAPLAVDDWRGRGEGPETVEALTEAIAEALRAQILEADDQELWHGFRAVAAWMASEGEPAAVTDARAREMSAAWRASGEGDREALAEEARAFAQRLEELGVDDPLALEQGPPDAERALRAWLPLPLLAPFAAIGALLGWPAYRAVGWFADGIAKTEDVRATWKLLVGAVLFPSWWALEAGLAAFFLGAGWAIALALTAPVCGLAALRFEEKFTHRVALGRTWWAQLTQAELTDTLREQRRSLAGKIQRTLAA